MSWYIVSCFRLAQEEQKKVREIESLKQELKQFRELESSTNKGEQRHGNKDEEEINKLRLELDDAKNR